MAIFENMIDIVRINCASIAKHQIRHDWTLCTVSTQISNYIRPIKEKLAAGVRFWAKDLSMLVYDGVYSRTS